LHSAAVIEYSGKHNSLDEIVKPQALSDLF